MQEGVEDVSAQVAEEGVDGLAGAVAYYLVAVLKLVLVICL